MAQASSPNDPPAAETADKPVVQIFVRLGGSGADRDDSVREISFRIPEGIDPIELLEQGFAIDGRNASFTVACDENIEVWYAPFDVIATTMNRALAESQQALVKYLRERGYTPQFA